jgi:hypothetical protein
VAIGLTAINRPAARDHSATERRPGRTLHQRKAPAGHPTAEVPAEKYAFLSMGY